MLFFNQFLGFHLAELLWLDLNSVFPLRPVGGFFFSLQAVVIVTWDCGEGFPFWLLVVYQPLL